MFTPIGFFAPQVTGFDPTLGGTLTPAYWWDFTDSSTMSLTSTTVNTITDKIASETFTKVGTNTYTGTYTEFRNGNTANGTGFFKSSNFIPSGMLKNQNYMIIFIHDAVGTDGNAFQIRSNVSNGYNSAYCESAASIPGSYSQQVCVNNGSGNFFYMGRFNNSYSPAHRLINSRLSTAPQFIAWGWEGTTGIGYFSTNGGTLCSRSTIAEQNASVNSGNGFSIGRDSAGGGGVYDFNLYHCVVYTTGILSNTNVSDLYQNWLNS